MSKNSLFIITGMLFCIVAITPAAATSSDNNLYFDPNVKACDGYEKMDPCPENTTVTGCACYADGTCATASAGNICTLCSTLGSTNAALVSFNADEQCPLTTSNNVPLYVCNDIVLDYVKSLPTSTNCGLGCICYSDGTCVRDYVTPAYSCEAAKESNIVTLITTGHCPLVTGPPVASRGVVGQSSIRHY